MKPLKILFLFCLCLFPVSFIFGISFSGLNISNDDRLLFKTEFESQNALFISTLSDMSMRQLTAYPEKLQLVDNGRTIYVTNRFGAARIPVEGGLPVQLPVYPSFAQGNVPLKGRTQELAASPDGRWIVYIEPVSPAYGNLLLIEAGSGTKRIISERIELPAMFFPVKWSPDSRLFVYAKDGRLFYSPIVNDMSTLADERFRMIGSGGINSILWGQHGDFFYLTGNTLYCVRNPELFTRTIYGDFLSIGSVTALFPFDFDSGLDKYWIAPDSGSIMINKNGKGLFIFLLAEYQNSGAALVHITIPFWTENINVLWSAGGQLAVSASQEGKASVWRFEINREHIKSLSSSDVPAFSSGALSPDGSMAVFWGENGFELWDFLNWRLVRKTAGESVLFCIWTNNEQFISGNAGFIEEINISNNARRRICLSGADEFGFETPVRGFSRILARVGNEWFATDGRSSWVSVSEPQLQQVSLSSERYRVFLEPQAAGHFKNVPLLRNINSVQTVSLVSGYSAGSAYTSGRQLQIALCFDLYDDDSGLLQVLTALRRYNAKATFFLNGDFIRRYPAALSAIVKAGHETASLFYAPIDFSDSRYRITHDFIVQGLARNEDEFFKAVGKPLSLLWHPPFYSSSGLITAAAAAAGYTTVTRTFDPGDWISREEAVRLNIRQTPASGMIEQIIGRSSAGAVIPIRLGQLPGGRDEYLFQRIDVLLDALARSGIEIVPVSAVVR
ncbi:MAG: polysaccharide deacetylase family protein [Treponema sp.]|jgi:peptidoglycan/xylan/chitin deacetylase (PgdA/CDA1 family)|nr:polysaccharide deacetylase family protein [Treponema sp.]